MLGHGNHFAPARMCCFWAPLGRVASPRTAAKIVQGTQVSAREVINICQGAWDANDGAWIFQILVIGEGSPNQTVFIRADPTSKIKHTILPDDQKAPRPTWNNQSSRVGWKDKMDTTEDWSGSKSAGGWKGSGSGSNWQDHHEK